MNLLKAGFARVNITPMLGIGISGYFIPRIADGVLDDLEANAIVLECGEKRVAMVCLDNCGVQQDTSDLLRAGVTKATGLPAEAIFIASTHTHTGPYTRKESDDPLEQEYLQFLIHRIADAVCAAIDDLKPAKMGYAIGNAPHIAFVRRYLMKDGSIKTNPGVNNPDVVEPVGEVDERVNVVRFDREGADSIVLVNFGNHPDVVGGCKLSADWPGFLRRTVEKTLDGTKCLFFNGAQGDVNHVNVFPRGGDMNDMFMDFDDVSRGYAHARYMGRVVAGAVLQAFDKVYYTDVDSIGLLERKINVPSNRPDPKDLPEAERIEALHKAGKDDQIPFEGMMLTTVVAEAERMIRLKDGPDFFDMRLLGVRVGPIAFLGIPGEPFTGIGMALKETEGFEMILPVCLTNGDEGYFPMQDSYDEGGYESRSSIFKAGVAEFIIKEGKELLKNLR